MQKLLPVFDGKHGTACDAHTTCKERLLSFDVSSRTKTVKRPSLIRRSLFILDLSRQRKSHALILHLAPLLVIFFPHVKSLQSGTGNILSFFLSYKDAWPWKNYR